MPRIRPTGIGMPLPKLRARLVELLVKELAGERLRDGPVIFEAPTGRAGEADVIVIWEAWESLPSEDRSTVIRESYAKFEAGLGRAILLLDPAEVPDVPGVPRVSMTIGATWEEALSQGLLPYSVRPQVRDGGADPGAIRQAMVEAGAIETPTGVELRFPSGQLASEAQARLMREMPEARWTIVDESGSFGD